MSKVTKIWLITAFSLILIGICIFVGVMVAMNWNLSTSEYKNNEYEINEEYRGISIITETADIDFLPSENGKTSVALYEQKNAEHSVAVKDGVLTVELEDTRKWYEHLGINWRTPKITVYLPSGDYGALSVNSTTGDLKISKDFKFESLTVSLTTGDVTSSSSVSGKIKIKTTTGDIRVENSETDEIDVSLTTGDVSIANVIVSGDVKVKATTGKVELNDVECKNIILDGTTGDVILSKVNAKEKLSVERSTGDVTFYLTDAKEIFVKTTTGDVCGTLLSDKIFITKTSTGRVNVPTSTVGGKCEITTSTGDIKISVE